jgi:2-methylcitrate dehydratase PrpD
MSVVPFILKASEFVSSVGRLPIDQGAINAAHEALIDYFGVTLAGASEPVARNVYAWASQRCFGRGSSVIGQEALDPENAALCNAVSGHALDFDDTSWTTIGHPTTVVGPAAVAIGESVGACGRDTLIAYLAGVEVAHRLADLSMPEASRNGWHTTGIFYALGGAAAACVLLRLDIPTVINSLGLAVSRSGGVRSNFGTHAKPYHAGMAARNGLEAVSLARAGLTASATAVDGADGFLRCFAGKEPVDRSLCETITFGSPFDILSRGLAFKRYPCCSGSHPACDLVLDLATKHNIRPDDVSDIQVGVSLLAERELVCHSPKTPREARFSMEFVLAAALTRRLVTLDTFDFETLGDPAMRCMMSKVRMSASDELAKLGFIGTAPVRPQIKLNNGEIIQGSRDLAIGNPELPMSARDREKKFLMCARGKMSEEAADRTYAALLEFVGWENVATHLKELRLIQAK